MGPKKCGQCHEVGHNIRTCKKPKQINASPFLKKAHQTKQLNSPSLMEARLRFIQATAPTRPGAGTKPFSEILTEAVVADQKLQKEKSSDLPNEAGKTQNYTLKNLVLLWELYTRENGLIYKKQAKKLNDEGTTRTTKPPRLNETILRTTVSHLTLILDLCANANVTTQDWKRFLGTFHPLIRKTLAREHAHTFPINATLALLNDSSWSVKIEALKRKEISGAALHTTAVELVTSMQEIKSNPGILTMDKKTRLELEDRNKMLLSILDNPNAQDDTLRMVHNYLVERLQARNVTLFDADLIDLVYKMLGKKHNNSWLKYASATEYPLPQVINSHQKRINDPKWHQDTTLVSIVTGRARKFQAYCENLGRENLTSKEASNLIATKIFLEKFEVARKNLNLYD